MTNINRCPRCGREVEGDFCPQCDLHSNNRGVYRTLEDKQRIAEQTEQWLAEKKKAQQDEEDKQMNENCVFPEEQTEEEPFSKEVFNRTVGEVLEEQEQNEDAIISEIKEIEANEQSVAEELAVEQAATHQEAVAVDEVNADVANNDTAEDSAPTLSVEDATENLEITAGEVEQAEDTPDSDLTEDAISAPSAEAIDHQEAKEAATAEPTPEVAIGEAKKEDSLVEAQELLEDEVEALDEKAEQSSTVSKDDDDLLEQRLAEEEARKEAEIPEDYIPPETIKKPDLSGDLPEQETKRWNQKHVMIISIAIIVVAILFGSGFTYYQHYQAKQLAATKEQRAITAQIDQFYVDHNPKKGFLAEKVSREKTQSIRDHIDELAKVKPDQAKQLDKELATVQSNQELMDKVNALFVSTKLKGDHIYHPALKENQTIQLVEMKQPKTDFDRAVNESIRDARDQQATMKAAQLAVDQVYDKGSVKSGATTDELDKAKKAVDQVQNTTMKDRLSKELDQVQSTLKQRQKEKFAKETAKERAQAQKITGDRQYRAVDEDDKAWDWAPGVRNKVINTCIQRGYITKDGYELRKAYVIGNDGYYNLYGTNNRSSLLKGYSSSELPVYLVTINCKTGWFKGGAQNK